MLLRIFTISTILFLFLSDVSPQTINHTSGGKLKLITPSISDTLGGKLVPQALKEIIDRADSLDSIVRNRDSLIQYLKAGAKNAPSDIAVQLRENSNTLAIWLLIFCFLLILAILGFLAYKKAGIGNYAFQILGLVIVVTASLFLVVTGYDKDQITPIIGLLGTIVGFIFGSNLSSKDNNEGSTKNDKSKPSGPASLS